MSKAAFVAGAFYTMLAPLCLIHTRAAGDAQADGTALAEPA